MAGEGGSTIVQGRNASEQSFVRVRVEDNCSRQVIGIRVGTNEQSLRFNPFNLQIFVEYFCRLPEAMKA